MEVPELHFEEGSNLEPLPLYPGPLLLGRDADCDRLILHKKVSKRHAIVERTDEGWFIHDAGSSNGTFVNGVACTKPHPIYHGDLIKFGTLHATFEAPEVRARAAATPQRFRAAARRAIPTQRARLDLPAHLLSQLGTTLWIMVGVALALFIYLAVLAHRHPAESARVCPKTWGGTSATDRALA